VLRRRPRYRHAHRANLSLGFVLAAAALIGCGGGDETTTGYPPGVARPIDKVEFLREADRICESTNARVEAAADDLVGGRNGPPPAEVRRIVLAIVIPALQTEVDAISSLGAPEGDERKVSAIIAAVEAGIDELRADPLSALDGPPPGLVRAGRLAAAYGSRTCDVRQSG
jgi:hypothetical protein